MFPITKPSVADKKKKNADKAFEQHGLLFSMKQNGFSTFFRFVFTPDAVKTSHMSHKLDEFAYFTDVSL